MRQIGLGIAVVALGLAVVSLASASSKPPSFKLGKYTGHTSQVCSAAYQSGEQCSPVGAAFPISFTVHTIGSGKAKRILIIDLVWTEEDICTGVPTADDHSTLTVPPIDVYVKKGKFSFKQSSQAAQVHIQGRFRGKRASGTINDVYVQSSSVTCATGAVSWSAATK